MWGANAERRTFEALGLVNGKGRVALSGISIGCKTADAEGRCQCLKEIRPEEAALLTNAVY